MEESWESEEGRGVFKPHGRCTHRPRANQAHPPPTSSPWDSTLTSRENPRPLQDMQASHAPFWGHL